MSTPVAAVVGVLSAAVALDGVSVRSGFPQDSPDKGIWVVADGGLPPVQELGTGLAWHQPRVLVYCRVGPRDHDDLETLAAAARSAINQTAPAGYTQSVASGDVRQINSDSRQRHISVFAAQLTIRE